jgi:hypothetical protein
MLKIKLWVKFSGYSGGKITGADHFLQSRKVGN